MQNSTLSLVLTGIISLGCACGGDSSSDAANSGGGSGATTAAGSGAGASAGAGSGAGAGGRSDAGNTGGQAGAAGSAGTPASGASGSNMGGAGAAGAAAGMSAAGMSAAGSVAAGSGTAGVAGMGAAGTMAGAGATTGPLTLTSTAVKNGEMLPKKHRCVMFNGNGGVSPALSWSGGPAAMSYAVTLHDLTANIMHWTLYDVPATTTSLPEGLPIGAMPATPAGAKQTPNQLSGMTGPGYFGPCGGTNRNMYEFAVHALDVATLPDLGANPTAAQARMAITMHTLPMGKATLGITSSSSDP